MADNHGNTPAAWTAVVVALLGFTVGGIGVMFTPMNEVLFYGGVAIVVVAGVLYLALEKLGFGSEH
jgi:cytosine/uracil/thiamine/allantoin permease